MKLTPRSLFLALAAAGLLVLPRASAQITNTVFSEDFSGPINTNRLVPDSPFFEGGKGDIAATVRDGQVEFYGTVTEQWWAGATLRVVPTFPVSAETNVMVTVDRVAEAGVGSASRSALWIMDATRTKYVLFADVRGEEGWRYNRKIGVSGDQPTGGGVIMTAFDGAEWDDGGQHEMKVLANGKTVKLYLDNTFGAEVQFPYDTLVVQIGSYARANEDVANTIFDNLKVENIGAAAFSANTATLVSGQTVSNVTVRIPPGVNNTQAVTVQVKTSDPTIAVPVGATGDTLSLTFAAGASNEQAIGVRSVGPSGSAVLSLTNSIGMASANTLTALVVEGFGERMTDEFAGATLDATKWTNSTVGFEATGAGTFEIAQTGGQLVISGTVDQYGYWPGTSIKTTKSYTATPALPLVFEIDRVSIDPNKLSDGSPSTAARTGVYLTTGDRSQYVFFGQNVGETGWQVNVNPGNPTGSGTAIGAFSSITNTGSHRIKMVADGSNVEVFLDDKSGGKFPFAVSSGVFIEVGAYARDFDDSVKGVFDNARIHHIVAPISIAPNSIFAVTGVNTNVATVTVSTFLTATDPATVTVTSSDPNVAVPEGASNGRLTLNYPAGGTNALSFAIRALSPGTATLTLTNDQGIAAANSVSITVVPPPVVALSDDFSSTTIDTSKWRQDTTPLVEGGMATADSSVFITNGEVAMFVTAEMVENWPGFALFTTTNFTASALSPVDFEIDRTKMEYVLVGGTSAKERTGVWIKDATTNYVFFSELGSWDAIAGGWQYHRVIGQAGDNPITTADAGSGTYINAFNAASYLDQKSHHIKVIANGATVRLYLDGVFGAEVPFPFTQGLVFGFGSYVNFSNALGNIVRGFFDNAVVHTYPAVAQLGSLSTARDGANLVISWTGSGVLQSASSLPATWTDVTPAPTGNSHTVTPASGAQQYYRLRQP